MESKWFHIREDELPSLTENGFTDKEFGMLNHARQMIRAGEALMADAHQDALKRKRDLSSNARAPEETSNG